ncbi:hypothetical protein SAMN04488009_1369 [Maribacter sedimenticola]|uniref:Uncharacterized protein n=1 Tax=Maribacter sedimenticola TaxID=228956 RepID=A0ABY1SEZ4_9FLAO|nr:DUF6327 family protein [Maribacter sedimenticola]SNR39738.1 hypothetical protein SAMN04488009_1369 [Maribacter sedimenticola]
MTKAYTSFKEIDNRLKVLELQREINKENLKLLAHHAKVDLVPQTFRTGIGAQMLNTSTVKSAIITFFSNRLLRFIQHKRTSKKS